MAKIDPGSIFEIEIDGEFYYGICTHVHPIYGELIRMVRGGSRRHVTNHPRYHKSDILFSFFFPLSAAVMRGIVRIVDRGPISASLSEFPLFRVRGFGSMWWVWNGVDEYKIGALTTEARKLPVRGIWNDTILKERIRAGYAPEREE